MGSFERSWDFKEKYNDNFLLQLKKYFGFYDKVKL